MKLARSIILILLCIAFVPSVVNGDPLTYKIEGETVTVVDCDQDAAGEVVIPAKHKGKPVTSIGNRAFEDCRVLTGITIPNSVNNIGELAFINCRSLIDIIIPNGVQHLKINTFIYCFKLRSVELPSSITSIGVGAFHSCRSLENVILPDGISSLPHAIFIFCESLTDIMIPEGVTSIGNSAFYNCSSLTSVTIPDSVTSIGEAAFSACERLKTLIIGKGVTRIEQSAFEGCERLKSVTIPDDVTTIRQRAFFGCVGLKTLIIGKGVTRIEQSAFENCNMFWPAVEKPLIIPNKVTFIGARAFYNMKYLTSLRIGNSVTSIEEDAFNNCENLKKIVFEGNAPSQVKNNIFKNLSENAKIFVYLDATGFGENFVGLPVQNLLAIKSFNNHAVPFFLTFETQSDSTYKIEASHDLKKWGEIGEVQGTGSTVKFIERRKAMFPQQYYRVKEAE